VVTADGCEIITRFPAEKLMVAGSRYYTATGPLPTTRETASHLNRSVEGNRQAAVAASARAEGANSPA
jgi:hypothetical protein